MRKTDIEPHLSARQLSEQTGFSREFVHKRLRWGCGEESADSTGRVTLAGFLADLDEADQQRYLLHQIGRQRQIDASVRLRPESTALPGKGGKGKAVSQPETRNRKAR